MERPLRIGELAARTGVTARTIRFYEAVGVVPPPVRSENGYRLYGREAADLLRFVKQARRLDLTLAEIKTLVAIRRRGEAPCSHVYRLLDEKAQALARKLKDLTALRRELRRNARQARPPRLQDSAVCALIEARAGRVRVDDAPESRRGSRASRARNLGRGLARRETRMARNEVGRRSEAAAGDADHGSVAQAHPDGASHVRRRTDRRGWVRWSSST